VGSGACAAAASHPNSSDQPRPKPTRAGVEAAVELVDPDIAERHGDHPAAVDTTAIQSGAPHTTPG
jgi:hypothetical protein